METREWRFFDKSGWGPGPWIGEPDKRQWTDKATGLPCLIVRNQFGALCGYVGVSAGHPMFEHGYDDVDADVHGGLTFAGHCQPDKEHGVCHVVQPGEDDNVWWLGFDCGHGGDYMPAMMFDKDLPDSMKRLIDGMYRSMSYVKRQVQELAAQLAANS